MGFRVVQALDHTRTYRLPADWSGREATGETARPMQLAIWYPARPGAGATPLSFGEYVDVAMSIFGAAGALPDGGGGARSPLGFLESEGPLRPYFPSGVPDSAVRRIRATPTAAVRDAPAASGGGFPVVLSLTLSPAMEHSVRFEYLASHGYVVVAMPWLGTSPAYFSRGEWTPAAIQAMAQDMGFAYARARTLPFADVRRLAWLGAMTPAGLAFQTQTGLLDALVSTEGFFDAPMDRVPGYDVVMLHVPVLSVLSGEARQDSSTLLAMRYAERHLAVVRALDHAGTYQFRRIARPERAAAEHRDYDAMSRYALAFLDAHVKGDAAARARLALPPAELAAALGTRAESLDVRRLAALPRPPTEAEFLAMVREGRLDEAARVLAEVRGREPGHRPFSYQSLQTAAIFLNRDRGPRAALQAYALLLEAYPGVPRTHYLMAQAHERLGDRAAAVREFERALAALSTTTPPLSAAERTRWEGDIRGQIERLRSGRD